MPTKRTESARRSARPGASGVAEAARQGCPAGLDFGEILASGERVLVLSYPLEPALPVRLTERERTLIDSVRRGESNAQIAGRLGASTGVVANQLRRLYAKVGVRSRWELLRELAARRIPEARHG